jgi:hypothetical protein
MTHVVTGDRDEVRAALKRAHTDGRLLSISNACLLPGNRVWLIAVLLDPLAPQTPWQRIRPWVLGIAALAGVAAFAVLSCLVVSAVVALVAAMVKILFWIIAHLLLIGLFFAVSLLIR